MANRIQIPTLNPIRLVLENYTQSAKYDTKHFDDFSFSEQVYPWEQGGKYFQKYKTVDTVTNHIISNYGPVSCKLIDCYRNTIKSGTSEVISTNYYQLPDVAYRLTIDFSGVPNGVYFFNVLVGTGGAETSLISIVPIEIKSAFREKTILFEYTNSQNKGGIVFDQGDVLALRVEAGLADYQPGSNDVVFADQIADLVTLNSQTFRSWKLVVGGDAGIPDVIADVVKEALSCDKVLYDGKQFSKADGSKWERNGDRNYALAGWSIDVRESKNREGLTIENNIPLDQSVAVIYVADPQLFGKTGDVNLIKVQ